MLLSFSSEFRTSAPADQMRLVEWCELRAPFFALVLHRLCNAWMRAEWCKHLVQGVAQRRKHVTQVVSVVQNLARTHCAGEAETCSLAQVLRACLQERTINTTCLSGGRTCTKLCISWLLIAYPHWDLGKSYVFVSKLAWNKVGFVLLWGTPRGLTPSSCRIQRLASISRMPAGSFLHNTSYTLCSHEKATQPKRRRPRLSGDGLPMKVHSLRGQILMRQIA